MDPSPGTVLFALASLGLLVLAAQHAALRLHCAPRRRPPGHPVGPGVSILKPLCGIDDQLEENLATFASLDYRDYEVLLGVRSTSDAAWAVALRAARRWPHRFRAVIQRGEPGHNPKVNQLIGLATAARHDLLVISDSNVRVEAGYLAEIAEALRAPEVGLVTHPVAGAGERRLGSLFDNLHLAGSVTPGMVAAKRLAGQDIVVGKSMALRRADLEALGGFDAVKDVLAEDYVLGRWVTARLGKRVVLARTPVTNVNERRGLADFYGRYARWSVMQRKAAGTPLYLAQLLLNPVLLGALGLAAAPSGAALLAFLGLCATKAGVDGANGRLLRTGGFPVSDLMLVPLKDLLFGAAWLHGLLRNDVVWRGNRLRVLRGTRLAPAHTGDRECSTPRACGSLVQMVLKPIVAAVEMGYGHLRAAAPIAAALSTSVLHVDRAPVANAEEERLWRRARGGYEWVSRLSQLPWVGLPIRQLLDSATDIPRLHPRRDLSTPTQGALALDRLIRRGLGDGGRRRGARGRRAPGQHLLRTRDRSRPRGA